MRDNIRVRANAPQYGVTHPRLHQSQLFISENSVPVHNQLTLQRSMISITAWRRRDASEISLRPVKEGRRKKSYHRLRCSQMWMLPQFVKAPFSQCVLASK